MRMTASEVKIEGRENEDEGSLSQEKHKSYKKYETLSLL